MTRRQPAAKANLRQPRRRRDFVGVVLWTLAALSAIAMASALALLQVDRSDRIMARVETMGINLGGMSTTQAARVLQQQWDEQSIETVAGDSATSHTPTELGILLDAETMARAAHTLGRSPEHIAAIVRRGPPISVPAVWAVDPARSEAFLRGMASQFDRAVVEAGLRWQDGTVEATPSESGRAMDVTGAVSWLAQHATELLVERRWTLPVESLSPPIRDAGAAAAEANRLLANTVTVRIYDPLTDESWTWAIAPDEWAPWLNLGLTAGEPPGLRWQIDDDGVRSGLQELEAALGSDRRLDTAEAAGAVTEAMNSGSWTTQLRVYHRDRQYTVQEGDTLASIAFDHGIPYPWIQQANPGAGDNLQLEQLLTIPSPDVLLPLPVHEGKRITISLSSQMMWAYEDDDLRWLWQVSTGMPSSPTSPGVFQIQTHELDAYAAEWDLSMPHFMGIYEPGPGADVMNGFHGFPSRGGTQLLWTNSLGRPVTYGCILISSENATALYDWAEEGIVVEIHP
jgi:lipoprotein-anchoring transpeptidase ErfK/SrfK